jgi:ribosomal-protein-alanine N-acetyltransferase
VLSVSRRSPIEAHFTPAVEVAWRLTRPYWSHGYATEAARASLDYGFGRLGLDEIVAVTVPANRRSRQVMRRLGMTRQPEDDFDHPNVPEGSLKRCVLYRLRKLEGAAAHP